MPADQGHAKAYTDSDVIVLNLRVSRTCLTLIEDR